MTDGDFKEKVYGPYSEAWKILKLLQFCSKSNNHKNWSAFMAECNRFSKEANNPFAERTARFLLDAAEDIALMNEGGANAKV